MPRPFPSSRPGLTPLREAGLHGIEAREARMEERLRRSWPLVVGHLLAHHTQLIRIRNGTLLVGSWQMNTIPYLRSSAEATWPQVQERIARLFKFYLHRIEIVPCDPPLPPAPLPAPSPQDPLKALLELLRKRHQASTTPTGQP